MNGEAFSGIPVRNSVAVVGLGNPLAMLDGPLREEHLKNMRQIVVRQRRDADGSRAMVLSKQVWLTDSHLATLSMVQLASAGVASKTLIQPLD